MPAPGINVVLFEDDRWSNFLPLVYLRPVFDLLCGMDSLAAKVERLVASVNRFDRAAGDSSAESNSDHKAVRRPLCWTRRELVPLAAETRGAAVNGRVDGPAWFLNGRGVWRQLPADDASESPWVGVAGPDQELACLRADAALASRLSPELFLNPHRLAPLLAALPRRDVSALVELFRWPWELVLANARNLLVDWRQRGYRGECWGKIDPGAYLLAPEGVHIGLHSRIKPTVVIDAENGPVWIGESVTIMPHSFIAGPAFIGDHCVVKAGARLQGGTTIGAGCKVGGEIDTAVMQGFSNKQHDGFLGHSYLGEWVNVAAGCTSSNLKNTYGTVRVPINGREVETGERLVGMLVGDHAKLGINLSVPTGAVIGFSTCVFATRAPKFAPSCTWWDCAGIESHSDWEPLDQAKAVRMARRMMARRNCKFTPLMLQAFQAVWQQAAEYEEPPADVDAEIAAD